MMAKQPRPLLRLALFLAPGVILVGLEVAVIIWIADSLGLWTLPLMLATSVLGIVLLVWQWGKAWKDMTEAMKVGELPPGHAADAVLILIGGILLFLPGFVTDAAGLTLLIPFTRGLVRRGLGRWASQATKAARSSPTVIEGEVVDEQPDQPPRQIELPAEQDQ